MKSRSLHWASRRRADERGATLVLVALLIVAILLTAATVIDLSVVRQNRQDDKSATDFAAAAGIRALDDGTGKINIWQGICTARDFLRVNHPELSSLTHITSPDPCDASPLPTEYCTVPSDSETWTGLADGGRIRVRIENGYDLSSSGFSEDADEYSGDAGDDPCEHLAVIIEEAEGNYFGGVAGADGYKTTIRSVARLDVELSDSIAAALILLERQDCLAVNVSGNNASVTVGGALTFPGAIHADSTGELCGRNEFIFSLSSAGPPPRIVAQRAVTADADGNFAPGQISAVALTGAAGAKPGSVSDGIDDVCAQEEATDCGDPSTGLGPAGRELVGRKVVDDRYRDHIVDLRSRADDRFAISNAIQATAAGYVPLPCNSPGPFVEPKVWIDCSSGNQTFEGAGKVFDAVDQEVVIYGNVGFSGAGTMEIVQPAAFYLNSTKNDAISMSQGTGLSVNAGGVADGDGDEAADGFVCDDRHDDDQSARTEFVIRYGTLRAQGGTLALCQTTLFLMDNRSGDCAVPTAENPAPTDNGCRGNLSVAGGSAVIDWTAPNQDDVDERPDLFDQFEDLALWSETSGAGGGSWDVQGGGGLHMAGIYFTPNANPFKVAGGGSIDIFDAQFVTRRLEVAGGGALVMKPQPQNAVKIPELSNFQLIR